MHYAMNKKSFFLQFVALLFLSSLTTVNGQETADSLGTLTLKECIRLAQKNSPVAKSYRYDLIASKWTYREYHADLLPSLVLSGEAPNYRKSISNYTDSLGIHLFSNQQSNANVSLGIQEKILPTGGTISLSTGITRLGIFHNENTYLWKSNPLQLSITQPIFQFNELKWRHKLEPLQYKIAQKQYNQKMEDLAVQISNAFFNVILAKTNKEDANFNVARNDSIYNISKGRYRVGKIAENELLQTELEFHNAQEALSKAQISYQQSLNNFKILLGYPTDVEVKLKTPQNLPQISVDITKAKRLALKNNSQSLSYRLDKLQADQSLAQAHSEGGFQATVQASYGLNQRSMNFADLYKNPQNQQFFSVSFNMPLFNWGKHLAQIHAAENQQHSVANNVQYEQRQFMQSVQHQIKDFLQLRGQARLAAESDTIARRRYQVAENRYRIGKISITDLFIAQGDKDNARQGYIRALRDFWTGWYNLRKLTLYDFQEDQSIRHTIF
jgi:outer membrane protein TolC